MRHRARPLEGVLLVAMSPHITFHLAFQADSVERNPRNTSERDKDPGCLESFDSSIKRSCTAMPTITSGYITSPPHESMGHRYWAARSMASLRESDGAPFSVQSNERLVLEEHCAIGIFNLYQVTARLTSLLTERANQLTHLLLLSTLAGSI